MLAPLEGARAQGADRGEAVPETLRSHYGHRCERRIGRLYQQFIDCVHWVLEEEVGVQQNAPRAFDRQNAKVLRGLEKQRDTLARYISLTGDVEAQSVLSETKKLIRNELARESRAGYFNWKSDVGAMGNNEAAQTLARTIRNRVPNPPIPLRDAAEELEKVTGQRLARGGGNSLRGWRNPLESGERPFSEEAVRELLAGSAGAKPRVRTTFLPGC